MRRFLPIIFLALSGPSAVAQERLFRSVDAIAGQQTRVGMVGNVAPDCKVGPLPEVKVLTSPKNGQLAVRDGKTKVGALSRCPTLEVPARGLFYVPKAKFSGSDEIVYEVKRPDGKVQVHTVKITVSEQAKPGSKPQDGTEL